MTHLRDNFDPSHPLKIIAARIVHLHPSCLQHLAFVVDTIDQSGLSVVDMYVDGDLPYLLHILFKDLQK
jgi:hypothetical protein